MNAAASGQSGMNDVVLLPLMTVGLPGGAMRLCAWHEIVSVAGHDWSPGLLRSSDLLDALGRPRVDLLLQLQEADEAVVQQHGYGAAVELAETWLGSAPYAQAGVSARWSGVVTSIVAAAAPATGLLLRCEAV